MTQIQTGYKFLRADMTSANGNSGKWVVGEWKKHDGKLVMCHDGFHYSKNALDSLKYIYGDRWFKIEARGNILDDTDKSDASELRLVKEIPTKIVAVRFALACAQRVLNKFEVRYPKDDRPRKAIEAAEAWLKKPNEKNRMEAARAAEAAARAARAAEAAWAARAEIEWQRKTLEEIIEEVTK